MLYFVGTLLELWGEAEKIIYKTILKVVVASSRSSSSSGGGGGGSNSKQQ
jgi:hypothetical protein